MPKFQYRRHSDPHLEVLVTIRSGWIVDAMLLLKRDQNVRPMPAIKIWAAGGSGVRRR